MRNHGSFGLGLITPLILVSAAAMAPAVLAQAPATPGSAAPAAKPFEAYSVAIARDGVDLRSGPGMFYYPVSTLKSGAVLKVVGEDSGFLRVQYPQGMRALLKPDDGAVDAGGKTVKMTRPAKLMHPNQSGGYPFGAIQFEKPPEPGAEFQLVETIKGPDGKPTFYAVLAPAGSTGYINKDLVRRLSPEEAAAAARQAGAPVDIVMNPGPGTPATVIPAANPMPDDAPAITMKPDSRDADVAALEAIFKRVQAQPANEAEFEPAIAQFKKAIAKLGDSSADQRRARNLSRYAEVLELRLAVREAMTKPDTTKFEEKHAQVNQQLASMEKNGFFKVIGRLLPSTVYDGTRLPKLYRVVSPEPGSGRTLAYVAPQPGLDLDAKLGLIVGIAGDAKMDESLKANLIDARRVETLTLTPTGGSEPTPTDGR